MKELKVPLILQLRDYLFEHLSGEVRLVYCPCFSISR